MPEYYGFELLKDTHLPELNGRARLFRHHKSGAQFLSVENNDENKVFSINFRTPPPDDTGLPHIMEHSVLCGSRKYPVKEPFVELLKGSLKTFVNAMTFPDKTCYPVASTNLPDFYNLIDVYLDAALYPLLTPQTLQQEGWHYELESLDSPLAYKGVVFNEMKGNYSSPDYLFYDYGMRALYAGHIYGRSSGGDPAAMLDLSYEQFKTFHDTYYHPSNAYIYWYGDDNPEERLRYLEQWLKDFEARSVNSAVAPAPRFGEPLTVETVYDAGESEQAKAYISLNWLLPQQSDAEHLLALGILDHILTGTPASPLRKALLESGLGEDLTGGMETGLFTHSYAAGLKGVALENVDRVEPLVLQTLSQLAEEGIDPETVAASLNTVEFRLREQNSGGFPRGLFLMLSALETWLHDDDPLKNLAFEAPLQALKARLATGEKVFEGLLRRLTLDNPGRVTLIMRPDSGYSSRRQADEQARLAAERAQMGPAELQKVIESAEALHLRQETPDSPEALATIPRLKLADLEPRIKTVPQDLLNLAGTQVVYHDLFTNGILYLDLGLNLHTLPAADLPLVDLFGRALLEMGTRKESFVRLLQRIGRNTGGIRPSRFIQQPRPGHSPLASAWLFLRTKSTLAQAGELLEILTDVLNEANFDDRERFRQIVLEEKSGMEAQLTPAGHVMALTRLRAHIDEAGWAAEQSGGVSYLLALRKLAEELEHNWPAVLARLEWLRRTLINRPAMLVNVTLDADGWQGFRPQLEAFLASLPQTDVALQTWPRPSYSRNEGLAIPAQVNYVTKGANLFDLGYTLDGSNEVIGAYLRTTWLWEKVRVKGGAYGGFFQFDTRSGYWGFASYRDPNLLATLDNYDGAAAFLSKLDETQLPPQELTRTIIGAISALDAYQLPDARGFTATQRWLLGDSDELRQQYRDQVLSATLADFNAFGEVLARFNPAGQVVVIGSEAALKGAATELPGGMDIQKVL